MDKDGGQSSLKEFEISCWVPVQWQGGCPRMLLCWNHCHACKLCSSLLISEISTASTNVFWSNLSLHFICCLLGILRVKCCWDHLAELQRLYPKQGHPGVPPNSLSLGARLGRVLSTCKDEIWAYGISRQERGPLFFGREKEPRCSSAPQMTLCVEGHWLWVTDGGIADCR